MNKITLHCVLASAAVGLGVASVTMSHPLAAFFDGAVFGVNMTTIAWLARRAR